MEKLKLDQESSLQLAKNRHEWKLEKGSPWGYQESTRLEG